VLAAHRRAQLERRMLLGPGWRDNNLTFPDLDSLRAPDLTWCPRGWATRRWPSRCRHTRTCSRVTSCRASRVCSAVTA